MRSDYWFERLLDKTERRFGRFAIPKLTLYIVFLNAFVYLLSYYNPDYLNSLTLNIDKVLKGEVWRLFTYLFIPPAASVIFIFFALYFLYLIGSALEAEWGSFRLNFYYFLGMIGTTAIGIFLPSTHLSNVFINLALFLAFATLYPDFTVYLFFIIPIKVKYLAILSWLGIIFNITFAPLEVKLIALVSVINYLLFFWHNIAQNVRLMNRGPRPSAGFSPSRLEPFHKCSICGKTERDDEDLEFRVCRQCGKEFCSEHMPGHKH